jgi:hypothetical protein
MTVQATVYLREPIAFTPEALVAFASGATAAFEGRGITLRWSDGTHARVTPLPEEQVASHRDGLLGYAKSSA